MRNLFSLPKGGHRTMKYVTGVFSNFDSRVFMLFILLALTGAIIFFVKYQSYVDCDEIEFYTEATAYEAGGLITFRNETPNARSWKWDFGDGTVEYRQKNWVFHKYDKPGDYEVKLTINGDFCTKTREIKIARGDFIGRSKVPNIIAPKTAYVGDRIRFDFQYPGEVFLLEWRFGEGIRPDATVKNPEYVYYTSGVKKISLVVNGEVQYKAIETIIIEEKEPITTEDDIKTYEYKKQPEEYELPRGEPQEDPFDETLGVISEAPVTQDTDDPSATAPNISEEEFEQLLVGVANKSKTKEDFADYFCESPEKVVVVKNGDQLMNFTELCLAVRGKRIKIKSLKLTKNNVNCVVNIAIDYKVKKFLRLWWVKD